MLVKHNNKWQYHTHKDDTYYWECYNRYYKENKMGPKTDPCGTPLETWHLFLHGRLIQMRRFTLMSRGPVLFSESTQSKIWLFLENQIVFMSPLNILEKVSSCINCFKSVLSKWENCFINQYSLSTSHYWFLIINWTNFN